ncbi:Rgp1-domain-containing protein [Rhodofomes roseus]|uniref:Rgp1-domain-containing protein n=1 Tax=Rhodofomes roseus TaxID=34475 RepID=A0ABQ8KG32_9APHY|nr:Rgp1-domain-containing protein [Rhodofomes roseus]KAH9836631.1 Rgp1-domain-containing protein [Rhodofomes roseus]
MTETLNVDEAIRVVVAPSQASYFAGEPFSVTVTFTNTRTPDAVTPRSASHTHKRSAHSISSVPLARPPTSPGMLRTALPAVPTRNTESNVALTRKGLIGKGRTVHGLGVTPGVVAVPGRKPLVKSLSISITSHELEGDSGKGKSPLNPFRTNGIRAASPSSPRIPSPLARSTSFPIAPSHPHARKQSVLDGQIQVQDVKPAPSPSPLSPSSNPSTSSHSLSLDPIAESGSSPTTQPATPAFTSPILESIPPTIRSQIPSTSGVTGFAASRPPQRRPPQLGHGPPPTINVQPPRSAYSSSFPTANTELILYSYAQLVGTLSLTPAPGAVVSPEQARNLNHVRSSLLKRQVVGGGSMDMTPLLSPQSFPPGQHPSTSRPRHGRSTSVSSSIFSLLAPTPAPQTPVWKPSHRTHAPSMFSLFSSGQPTPTPSSGIGLGLGLGPGGNLGGDEDVDPETPLPTFEVQPSMLAVDLSLAPGESRSYTYSLGLPENLPPTFKGRTLKLSYQFILGVCRAGSSDPTNRSGATSANSSSRVMKVPIRLYCHVAVGRPPKPYDLLWPVSYWKSKGPQSTAKVIEEPKQLSKKPESSSAAPLRRDSRGGSLEELQDYATHLLSSLSDPDSRVKLPLEAIELERDREREEAGGLSGCRQAVEIITRNPRKASYDVNKDGVKVAVLTFTKSAYRLGETVLGVVELNERPSRARVLKLSAMLEAHESLPGSLCPATTSRQMRRVHAEHHSSFLPSTLRTTFSLDIPPDASPAFQVDVGADQGGGRPGGLEWKVRLCLLVAVASPTARVGADGARLRHLVRDGPGGQWGASWKAASTIAPMERPDLRAAQAGAAAQSPVTPGTAASWLSYFTAPLMGPASTFHDGDEDASDEGGTVIGDSEEEWREVKAEMVECEVPIRVWPGNTAFKATEVVFDV